MMMMMVVMEEQPNFKPVSSDSALKLHPRGNALMRSALTTDVPSLVEAMLSCSVTVQHHIWEGRRCPYLCPTVQSPPRSCPYLRPAVQCPHLGRNSIVHILRCNSIALMSTDCTEDLVSFDNFITVQQLFLFY